MKKIFLIVFLALLLVSFVFPVQTGKKKIQVEIFAGYADLNPADLNMVSRSRVEFYQFNYDDRFTYEQNVGMITSWNKSVTGEFQEIKDGFPAGFRVKYFLSSSFALSLGVKYMSRTLESRVNLLYTATGPIGDDTYNITYNPSSLFLRGITPKIGAHWEKKISNSLSIGGFASVGPIFAKCNFVRDYSAKQNYVGIPFAHSYYLKEEGSGIGIAAELGLRLSTSVGKSFGLFIEGAYAYQQVTAPSGPGILSNRTPLQYDQTWSGDWGIREYHNIEYWGENFHQLPSNAFSTGEAGRRVRDFKLDLSGFQVRIGFFLKIK